MKPITTIYWLRMTIGIISGIICAALSNFLIAYGMEGMSVLLYSVSLTLVIYLVSFRLLKIKFQNKIETPSKIATTGIFMYFLAWLVFYILTYTIIVTSTSGIA